MAVKISPPPRQQFEDANGKPISGGLLFTYAAGSTTKLTTYTTSVGDVANTNPIKLDSAGRTPYGMWLTDTKKYKLVLAPATDTDPPASPIFTEDNISGINDTSLTSAQWILSGSTPTYVNATTFTVPGDETAGFHVGRRLRLVETAGTVYGIIVASVYTTLTTVTMVMDVTALDSGLSSVDFSVLTSTNPAIPLQTPIVLKDAAYTVVANDRGKMIDTTGTWTLSLPKAAAVGSGFSFSFRNSGTGVITIDGDGAELIDGVETLPIDAGDSGTILCNGTAFRTLGRTSSTPFIKTLLDDANAATARVTLGTATATTKLPDIDVTMATDALTIAANLATHIDFRSATLADGTPSTILAAPANLVIPATATLGGANAAARYIDIAVLNVAGVAEFAVSGVTGGRRDEAGVMTTVAIDAASDVAGTWYSATARTDVPYRIVKRCVAINDADKWKAPTIVSDITPMSAHRRVVQTLNLTTGALATGTTLIPADDTIPQITEGDKYMELAITPTNALSILEVTVSLMLSANADLRVGTAIFRDAVADAVSCAHRYQLIGHSDVYTHSFMVVAGSVATTTFSVRAGGSAANTTTFNGNAGARIYGGSLSSSITIKEYLP